jgi:hypothetical protein
MFNATHIGHSDYRSVSPWFTLFHPLFLPITLIVEGQELSPTVCQVHHTYMRYNFGVFLRLLDKWHNTYKKSDKKEYDVHYLKALLQVKQNRALQTISGGGNIKFEQLAR